MLGKIYNEAAYVQAKMLDHSGWVTLLPRKMRPSDVDMVIDNNGRILIVELSSKTANWQELSLGQRLLYQNFVKAGKGDIGAALCKITPAPNKQINTVTDVEQFSLMIFKDGQLKLSPVVDGPEWIEYVKTYLRL